jgi:hypothetical protein
MIVKLNRIYQDDCTIGSLEARDKSSYFRCFTLELPYKNNASNVSCIPPGRYQCHKTESPSFGKCIAIEGVNGRSFIRIHPGNYTRQIEGCILPGKTIADIDGDGIPDVTSSGDTMDKLMAFLPSSFELDIKF